MKILLVDDETAILDTLSILFRGEGWDVTVPDSGPKAIAALEDCISMVMMKPIQTNNSSPPTPSGDSCCRSMLAVMPPKPSAFQLKWGHS